MDLDPREEYIEYKIVPIEEKKIYKFSISFQTTKIGTSLVQYKGGEIVWLLQDNMDIFIWASSHMLVIYANIIC